LPANRTPDQHGDVFVDAIIEGPNKWTVRPVMEIYADRIFDVSQTYSALVGAIWQVNDKLSFDVGLRYALVNGRPVNELRAGLTFGFPLNLGRPMNSESASAVPLGRR
jgi:outer membrane receptor protein involved in Fe transport